MRKQITAEAAKSQKETADCNDDDIGGKSIPKSGSKAVPPASRGSLYVGDKEPVGRFVVSGKLTVGISAPGARVG